MKAHFFLCTFLRQQWRVYLRLTNVITFRSNIGARVTAKWVEPIKISLSVKDCTVSGDLHPITSPLDYALRRRHGDEQRGEKNNKTLLCLSAIVDMRGKKFHEHNNTRKFIPTHFVSISLGGKNPDREWRNDFKRHQLKPMVQYTCRVTSFFKKKM